MSLDFSTNFELIRIAFPDKKFKDAIKPYVIHFPHTADKIQENKKEEFANCYGIYTEDIKAHVNRKKEEQKRHYTEAVGANYGMTIDDKPTFDEFFVNDEFRSET